MRVRREARRGTYQGACGLLRTLRVLVLDRVRRVRELAQLAERRLELHDAPVEPDGDLLLERGGRRLTVLLLGRQKHFVSVVIVIAIIGGGDDGDVVVLCSLLHANGVIGVAVLLVLTLREVSFGDVTSVAERCGEKRVDTEGR